jgi:hypothetical protein
MNQVRKAAPGLETTGDPTHVRGEFVESNSTLPPLFRKAKTHGEDPFRPRPEGERDR